MTLLFSNIVLSKGCSVALRLAGGLHAIHTNHISQSNLRCCLLIVATLYAIGSIAFAQTPQQLQSADTELNQVYQQLKGTLNDAQKQELKIAQRDWLKKRDAFVAANPGNPQGALYQATVQRVQELRNAISSTGKANTVQNTAVSSGPTSRQVQAADAELNQVYQQLRGTLNDAQKQELKTAQKDWLNQRDAFVAANPGNPQAALYQATMQRVVELRGLVTQTIPQQKTIEQQGVLSKVKHTPGSEVTFENSRSSKIDIPSPPPSVSDRLKKQPPSSKISQTTQGSVLTCPQSSGARDLKSASITSDGRLLTIGYNSPGSVGTNVDIWSRKDGGLLHSFVTGADFARTLPNESLLIALGNTIVAGVTTTGTEGRDLWPTVQYFSTDTREKLAELTFGPPDKQGLPCIYGHGWHAGFYIMLDGQHAVIEASDDDAFFSAGKEGKLLYYVYRLPSSRKEIEHLISIRQDSDVECLHPEHSLTKEQLNKAFPETTSLPPQLSESSVRTDAGISLTQIGDRCLVTASKAGQPLEFSGLSQILKNGMALSNDCALIALYGNSNVNIIESATLQKKQISLEVDGVECAAFSPDKTKLALLTYKNEAANSVKRSEDNKAKSYYGIVTDVNSGKMIAKRSIARELVSMPMQGKSDLRWIGDHLYLSDGAKFDAEFNVIETLKGCFFPASMFEPQILVKADVKAIKDESERRKSATSVSLINPETLKVTGKLPYDASQSDPTCPDLPPFDINPARNAILKGWKYWRGGGGMFVVKMAEKWDFDVVVGNNIPMLCRFGGDGEIIALCHNSDASQAQISYISLQSGQLVGNGTASNTTPTPPLSSLDIPISNASLTSVDGHSLYSLQSDGFVTRYDITPQKTASAISYIADDTCSLAISPDYFYLSRGNPSKLLRFTKGLESYPLEQFDLRLNRPDIVLDRLGAPPEAIAIAKELREKRLKRMAVTDDMLKPDFHLPELQIAADVPVSTPKDQIDLQIKATDDKYPLDRLRIYVNNVPVNGRDGELLRDQKTQSLERTIPVKLAAGKNKIQVSVLNSAGAESLYANADVTCTAERPKPKLYAVAIGVSQYDRPEWCLKYAVKDATDLVNQLKAKAGSAYSEVKPLLLTDKEVTKESVGKIKDFLSGATIDDTVLVFMAGHGILDDKYDYYFGTTDIDPEKPAERGMPYDAIDTILAEVPSLRKALLMDTCHAGELDADEKKELANEEGKGSAPSAPDASMSGKVAMRAIGTRGMSVKGIAGGKGKSDWYEKLQDMFVDLRRGSGATVISSSQGAEYAFESSEQSNGLFTYALMEALDGKAEKNKDGQITISAVGDYVKKRVQDLTKGKQNPNLRGVNLEEDFPLAAK